MATKIDIGGELNPRTVEGIVADASTIIDRTAEKRQDEINSEVSESLEGKQGVIADLETIRSGAASGSTAIQPTQIEDVVRHVDTGALEPLLDPSDYATTDQLNQLGQEVGELNLLNLIDPGNVSFEQGSFNYNGANLSSATRIRTDRALSTGIGWIGVPNGFLIHEIYYYSSWNSNTDFVFISPYKAIGKQYYLVDTTYPLFRFSIRKADNTSIVPDDYISLLSLISPRFIPLESAVANLDDKDTEFENTIKELDAELYGGQSKILPSAFKSLSMDTASRKIKYENGVFSIWISGVNGANIRQANDNILTDESAFISVDRKFWEDNTRGLILPVQLNVSQSVYVQIAYKYSIDGSTYTRNVTLTASADIDIKAQIKEAQPTGYKDVTFITFFSLYASSSPYGENTASIDGFKLTFVGDLPKLESTATKGFSVTPFAPFIYHFNPIGFIKDGDGHNAIAAESLEDIVIASRLGFDFIEANIKKTSDGEYVVLHGEDGKFGTFVKSNNPSYTDAQIRQMQVNSVTIDFIKQNIRYDSYYAKYQTQIPTLEEFLNKCKTLGLGVLAGVLSDEDATKKCIDILGNNLIVYAAPSNIRDYFNGYCNGWFDNASTDDIDTILATAKRVGAPFIGAIGPSVVTEMINNSTLEDYISTMHENGYLVGTSYFSEESGRLLKKMGVDVLTTTASAINRFDANYEVIDIDGDASQFTTTGSISGGVATLADANTLSFGSDNIIPLGKGALILKFNGSLTINFGSIGSRTIVSDGSEEIVVTDYFFRRKTQCVITANSATEIVGLVYLTSKC